MKKLLNFNKNYKINFRPYLQVACSTLGRLLQLVGKVVVKIKPPTSSLYRGTEKVKETQSYAMYCAHPFLQQQLGIDPLLNGNQVGNLTAVGIFAIGAVTIFSLTFKFLKKVFKKKNV